MEDRRINHRTYEHPASGQHYQLVGVLDRGAGALLDFFLLVILGVAVILAAVLLMRVTADSSALLALLSELSLLLLGPLYFLLCWYRWGKTPGMRAVDAELVDRRTLARPVWWRLVLRYLVFVALCASRSASSERLSVAFSVLRPASPFTPVRRNLPSFSV